MASKNRVVLVSRFPEAKRGARDALSSARDKALDSGEDAAERGLDRANARHGYNLPTDIEQERQGDLDGLIRYPQFYGRFFEYGTVHLPASPFMRPGHRAMRKRFVDEADGNFEGWVRRRTRLR